MQPSPQEWVVGSTIAGKFTVLGLLGRGGMGDVLEAEHGFTKRVGALKVLNRECAAQPALVERFIREASAAGRIGSPHIVEMFDAGISPEGLPYIFMELLVGQSLEEVLESRGALPFPEALDLALQAAEGLGAAHRAGIIHRDVKPANLFVVNQAGKPLVKVLDFGISKFSVADPSGPLTVVGTAMGTPLYMSYEQLLSSNSVDLRTDVYALGVVLYECLTARHPFNAETLVALSVSIQRGEFSPVSRLRPDVPKAIDSFFASCLAPIRDQRPKDMADLCAELRKFVAAGPAALAGHAAPGPQTADTQFAPRTPLVGSAAATTRASTAVPATQHTPHTSPPVNSAPVPSTQLSRATTGAASSVAVPVAKPRSSAVPALVAGGVILLAAGAFAVRMQASRSATTPPAASSGESASVEPRASAAPPDNRASATPIAAASDAPASPVAAQTSAKPAVDPAKTPFGGEPDARTRAKCARLLERLSLGETLGDQDARMYATACKKKRTP